MKRLDRREFLKGTAACALAGGVTSRRANGAANRPPPLTVAITSGPKHHFFGYYDKCPWDATQRYLLANEVDFMGRRPEPGELLTVGMVDLKQDKRYLPLDKTPAWCWQQGTMLQWLGSAPDRAIIYNSVKAGQYISIIRDVHDGKTRELPLPVYALSRDGKQAVSLDFDRVNRLRPGYGYIALAETFPDDPAPEKAGIYAMDVASGDHKLIIPIAWAAANNPDDRFDGGDHWFNHLQFNTTGTRFLFLHRWRSAKRKSWWTRLYTANTDGSDIRLLNDTGTVSHFDWRDEHTILAWTKTKENGLHFCLIDERTGEHTVVGDGVLTQDGHCSYSPDRKWILNDTYPDKEGLQTLMIYRVADGRRFDIGRYRQPKELRHKPYRCDLHPRWSRDGKQVCIDSSHDPTRQMYTIDVAHIVARSEP